MSSELDREIQRQLAEGGYQVRQMDILDNRGKRPTILTADARGNVVEVRRVGEKPSNKAKGPDDGDSLG